MDAIKKEEDVLMQVELGSWKTHDIFKIRLQFATNSENTGYITAGRFYFLQQTYQ